MKKKQMSVKIHACVLAWIMAAPVQAEIYRWVDEDGNVHFADRSPQHKPAEKLEQNGYDNIPSGNSSGKQQPAQVIMYATASCPVCQRAREYFASSGINFEEYDLDSDQDALLRYNELRGNGIPLILVDGERLDGFSEPAFDALYTTE